MLQQIRNILADGAADYSFKHVRRVVYRYRVKEATIILNSRNILQSSSPLLARRAGKFDVKKQRREPLLHCCELSIAGWQLLFFATSSL
jgi:hypothetical protein